MSADQHPAQSRWQRWLAKAIIIGFGAAVFLTMAVVTLIVPALLILWGIVAAAFAVGWAIRTLEGG